MAAEGVTMFDVNRISPIRRMIREAFLKVFGGV
jgi:hypothetical protein